MRGAAVGGIVMDAPTAKSTYLGRRTSRGTLLGPPVYYEPLDAAAIEAAFAELALAPPRAFTPVKQEPMSVEPASPGDPSSSVAPDRCMTRSHAAATEVLSIHSSPPASPRARPSKQPRILESSPAPSAPSLLVPPRSPSPRPVRRISHLPRVCEYIGAPPPDLAGFLARNDDDLVDSLARLCPAWKDFWRVRLAHERVATERALYASLSRLDDPAISQYARHHLEVSGRYTDAIPLIIGQPF